MEEHTAHPDGNNPSSSSRGILWLARYGAIPFLLLLSFFLVSTFFLAARPAFYYMEFIVLFVVGPFILLLAISYWPIYQVLRQTKKFPSDEARPLLTCWLVLLFLTAALLVSLPWQAPMKLAFALTAKAPLEQILPGFQAEAPTDGGHPIKAGIYSFRKNPNDLRNQGKKMALFRFENDVEQAFIYSKEGIADLNYNSGRAGRLVGDWYWVCED